MRRSLRRDQSGAGALEFALLVPVFLMLVLGMIDFCRAMWTWYAVEYAVEEAARYALAHPAAGLAAYKAQVTARLGGYPLTVDATATATTVSITATATFQFITPILIPTGSVPMIASATIPR